MLQEVTKHSHFEELRRYSIIILSTKGSTSALRQCLSLYILSSWNGQEKEELLSGLSGLRTLCDLGMWRPGDCYTIFIFSAKPQFNNKNGGGIFLYWQTTLESFARFFSKILNKLIFHCNYSLLHINMFRKSLYCLVCPCLYIKIIIYIRAVFW